MIRFVFKRFLGLIPTLLVIIVASFLIIRLAPGSPFTQDRAVPKSVLVEIEAKYGLDKPLPVQLGHYLMRLAHGDFGPSTKYPQRSVNEIIAEGLPITLTLSLVALAWALLVGVGAGIIGAVRQNSKWDQAAMAFAMLGISIPTFVLGPLLVLLFSLHWYLLPPGGFGEWRHVILPGITLGTAYAAYFARLTRAGLLEVTRSDYIRTAHAKGLPESTVIFRHMLRGGLLPVVTFLGPAIAHLMVGSVIVEKIFNIPGIGPYFVDAAFNRDYGLVMGIVVLESALLLMMNLLVDVMYAVLDPRIRLQGAP